LSSGFIAGGSLAGVLASFLNFGSPAFLDSINLGLKFKAEMGIDVISRTATTGAFAGLILLVLLVALWSRFTRTSPRPAAPEQ
jgi:hypothetical protein